MNTFTNKDLEILEKWFENQELPQKFVIDKAIRSSDLKKTVSVLLEQIRACNNNNLMKGNYHLLLKIKQTLEKQQNQ